jgi:hypothetical protein
MDLDVLEREVQADKAKGCLPVAVLATYGADLHQACPYQLDNLVEVRKLCDRHGLWLHAEGTSTLLQVRRAEGYVGATAHLNRRMYSRCVSSL